MLDDCKKCFNDFDNLTLEEQAKYAYLALVRIMSDESLSGYDQEKVSDVGNILNEKYDLYGGGSKTRRNKTRRNKTRRNKTRRGKTRRGKTRRSKTRKRR